MRNDCVFLPEVDELSSAAVHQTTPFVTSEPDDPRAGWPGDDVAMWPIASVRCLAAIRPELTVKATCQRHYSTDAIDPYRKSQAEQD